MPNYRVYGSDLALCLKWHTHILVCSCLIFISFSRVFQRWKLALNILPLCQEYTSTSPRGVVQLFLLFVFLFKVTLRENIGHVLSSGFFL